MEHPEHERFTHPGLTAALLNALEMAIEGDEKNEKHGWYNGLLFSIESLDEKQASLSVAPDGSTIASHADHILVTLRYVQAIFENETLEIETLEIDSGVNWDASWHERQRPNESEWNRLKLELHREYLATRALIEAKPFWHKQGLSLMLHHIAHTAYHAAAIRQILLHNRG